MSGPTPIGVTHRIEIQIIGGSNLHKVRWYLNAIASSDADGFDFETPSIGGSVGMSVALALFFPLVRAVYSADMTLGNVLLQKYQTGAWLPVGSAPLGNVGTAAGSFKVAQQTTTVYNDIFFKKVRNIFLETPNPYVGRIISAGALPAGLAALVADTLDKTAGHSGSWILSRGGSLLQNYIATTYDTNDKVRRAAGIV